MDDARWIEEAVRYYEVPVEVARVAIVIASRRRTDAPVPVWEHELDVIFPDGAPHLDEGRERLFGGGAFVVGGQEVVSPEPGDFV